MNTLRVETTKTETSPGEFVADGYRIVFGGETIYQSRFANKAVMKAAVLCADERFTPAVVEFEDAAADAAGKQHLQLMLNSDRFVMVRELVKSEPDVALAVDAIKVMGGNNVSVPAPQGDDEDTPF